MREKAPQEEREGGREEVIKANAKIDAGEYIKLMREKRPESLREFDPNGNIIINMVEGEKMFEEKKKEYELNSEEFYLYLITLMDRAAELLKN